MSNPKKNKYVFTLQNVDTKKVDHTYGIILVSNITDIDDDQPLNTTKLSELPTDKATPEIISFLDESKRLHKCNVSMIDFNTNREVHLLRYNCYWCRHPFDTVPLGCPIRYISTTATKSYHSEISKDTYTIKENITKGKGINMKDTRVTISDQAYYETDGVFCSWNCQMAFIEDSKHKRLYDTSRILAMKMYNEMMGTKMVVIDPAPHWRLLREYGGHMNIIDFRNSFNNADYEHHGLIKSLPQFRPVGMLHEVKLKF